MFLGTQWQTPSIVIIFKKQLSVLSLLSPVLRDAVISKSCQPYLQHIQIHPLFSIATATSQFRPPLRLASITTAACLLLLLLLIHSLQSRESIFLTRKCIMSFLVASHLSSLGPPRAHVLPTDLPPTSHPCFGPTPPTTIFFQFHTRVQFCPSTGPLCIWNAPPQAWCGVAFFSLQVSAYTTVW